MYADAPTGASGLAYFRPSSYAVGLGNFENNEDVL